MNYGLLSQGKNYQANLFNKTYNVSSRQLGPLWVI